MTSIYVTQQLPEPTMARLSQLFDVRGPKDGALADNAKGCTVLVPTLNDAITADQGTLAQIVGSSQGAVGILQATQATNQLLALLSKQTMQDQQLRIAEGRATALEQARMLQADEQGRANRQRFQGSGVRYTPEPVQAFRQ